MSYEGGHCEEGYTPVLAFLLRRRPQLYAGQHLIADGPDGKDRPTRHEMRLYRMQRGQKPYGQRG